MPPWPGSWGGGDFFMCEASRRDTRLTMLAFVLSIVRPRNSYNRFIPCPRNAARHCAYPTGIFLYWVCCSTVIYFTRETWHVHKGKQELKLSSHLQLFSQRWVNSYLSLFLYRVAVVRALKFRFRLSILNSRTRNDFNSLLVHWLIRTHVPHFPCVWMDTGWTTIGCCKKKIRFIVYIFFTARFWRCRLRVAGRGVERCRFHWQRRSPHHAYSVTPPKSRKPADALLSSARPASWGEGWERGRVGVWGGGGGEEEKRQPAAAALLPDRL